MSTASNLLLLVCDKVTAKYVEYFIADCRAMLRTYLIIIFNLVKFNGERTLNNNIERSLIIKIVKRNLTFCEKTGRCRIKSESLDKIS